MGINPRARTEEVSLGPSWPFVPSRLPGRCWVSHWQEPPLQQWYASMPRRVNRQFLLTNNAEISPIPSSGVSASSSSSSRESSLRIRLPDSFPILTVSPEVLELPAHAQSGRTRPESNIFDHIHKSTHRKVGEAPLWDVAPTRPTVKGSTTAAAAAPVSPKKKGWGFKKSTAVAAH